MHTKNKYQAQNSLNNVNQEIVKLSWRLPNLCNAPSSSYEYLISLPRIAFKISFHILEETSKQTK